VSDPEVVRSALDSAGLDGARLVERAADPAIKQELRERTDEALARGIFGAPATFVEGELYWGQDRLEQVALALGLAPEAARRFGAHAEGVRAEGRSVDFWYDFSSPFAYLASTRVQGLAERTGARVDWRPFLLGGLFRAIGSPNVPLHSFAESKQRFMRKDMQRHARAYGVPFEFPSRFPMRTVLPLRMALAAGPDIARLSHAVFRAYWGEDRDISSPSELARIAAEAGLDPTLVEGASDPTVKQSLLAAGEQAVALGLCGAPSFVVGDQVFWGQDRLGFVEMALGR
jgi:2-hydroxychromene-2-carboxylate isomerase